jgi:hypothetical protein
MSSVRLMYPSALGNLVQYLVQYLSDPSNTGVASCSYNKLVQYRSDQYLSQSPDTPSRGGKAFGATDDPGKSTQGQGRKRRKRNRGKGGKGNGGDKGNDPKRQQQQQQASQAHAVTAPAQLPQEPEYRNGWGKKNSHSNIRRVNRHGRPTASMDSRTPFRFLNSIRPRRPTTNSNLRPSFLL